MAKYIIEGGRKIAGECPVQGAKNSALPILAACVLVPGVCVIHNCPDLSDITATINILEYLGCGVKREGHTVIVDSSAVKRCDIPENLMGEMRSSIIFLGAVLARQGRAGLFTPGGCDIGLRPIDLHLEAMRRFGVRVEAEGARLECALEKRPAGTDVTLSIPSVGATENIMLMGALAEGTTILVNAAREPEISDLADFLNRCGAKIRGAGEGTIVIEGVKTLHGGSHTVIPDRIAAATLLTAAAMTNGKVCLTDVIPAHISPVLPVLKEAGCDIKISGKSILLKAPVRPGNARSSIRTMPYPGFPTDMQAPIMAMTAIADGMSIMIETIFESRYKHVGELIRMGARIRIEGQTAVIEGVKSLTGAAVTAPDLRGGSALVLAGLAAKGCTEVRELRHIDRGYENFEGTLSLLGAEIKRVEN